MIKYSQIAQHLVPKTTGAENALRVGERSQAALDIGLSAAAFLFDPQGKRGAFLAAGGSSEQFKRDCAAHLQNALQKLSAMGSPLSALDCAICGGNDQAQWQIPALEKILARAGLKPERLKDCLGSSYRKMLVDFGRGELKASLTREDSQAWNPASSALSIEDDVRVFSQNAASGKVANASRFFREEKSFKGIRELVLPDFLERATAKSVFKLWSACCSSGEEAYSYAMYLSHLRRKLRQDFQFHIFGTDINAQMLGKAGAGRYSVTHGALDEFGAYFRAFGKVEGQEIEMGAELKQHVSFREFDIRQEARVQKFKMIVCANVFQYYNEEARMHFMRNFIGACERPGFIYVNNLRKGMIEELGLKYYPQYGLAMVV